MFDNGEGIILGGSQGSCNLELDLGWVLRRRLEEM